MYRTIKSVGCHKALDLHPSRVAVECKCGYEQAEDRKEKDEKEEIG